LLSKASYTFLPRLNTGRVGDKPQEIKSQGNSSIVNNIKDNNGVIHNHNTTFINTILNNTTFINIIFNNTPTLPVFNLGKNVYNDFESNACAALEIIHLSNNVLYDFDTLHCDF
jgi:hypothetical protein